MSKNKKHKRVLLKLSGEALLGPNNISPYDGETMDSIAREIKTVHEMGIQVAVVVGGGNICRGEKLAKEGMDRVQADHFGMLATVQNGIALYSSLEEKLGVPTRLMSAIVAQQIAEPFYIKRARRHLEKGRVIVLAGGTGKAYFTTDTTAAVNACEIKATLIAKATNIDGIYDKDPRKNDDAKLLHRVTYDYCIEKKLQVMDQTAFTMCEENKIPIRVFSLRKPGNIIAALTGEDVGSLVSHEP